MDDKQTSEPEGYWSRSKIAREGKCDETTVTRKMKDISAIPIKIGKQNVYRIEDILRAFPILQPKIMRELHGDDCGWELPKPIYVEYPTNRAFYDIEKAIEGSARIAGAKANEMRGIRHGDDTVIIPHIDDFVKKSARFEEEVKKWKRFKKQVEGAIQAISEQQKAVQHDIAEYENFLREEFPQHEDRLPLRPVAKRAETSEKTAEENHEEGGEQDA